MRRPHPLFPSIRIRSVVLAAAGLLSLAQAQDGLDLGGPSFAFLRLPLSPRVTALGGAGAAVAEGPADAEVNPAAAMRDGGVLAVGQEYPSSEFGGNASHIGWSLPWRGHRILLHLRHLGFDPIPGFDDDNNSTTAYDAHTLKLQAGMATTRFGFDWGGSLGYARNHIASATYSAVVANAGVRRDLSGGFSAGASVTHLAVWTGRSMDATESVEPPRTLRAGIGYARTVRPGSDVLVALDARVTGDEDAVFPLGVEYTYANTLTVRAGYPLADPDNRLTLGVGLRWSRFGFQYAYRGHAELSGGHGWMLEIRDL